MIRKFLQLYIPALTLCMIAFAGVLLVQKQVQPTKAIAKTQTASEVQTNDQRRREILWLARIIYSETKRPDEQPVIGWVVRNRVDSTEFANSYKAVARAEGQFSGLHPTDSQYHHNITRGYESGGEAWQHALAVARGIYTAPDALRPFPESMQHFYSPVSIDDTPIWAQEKSPQYTITNELTGSVRFAFFADIR